VRNEKDIDILYSGEVILGVTMLTKGLMGCMPVILVFKEIRLVIE